MSGTKRVSTTIAQTEPPPRNSFTRSTSTLLVLLLAGCASPQDSSPSSSAKSGAASTEIIPLVGPSSLVVDDELERSPLADTERRSGPRPGTVRIEPMSASSTGDRSLTQVTEIDSGTREETHREEEVAPPRSLEELHERVLREVERLVESSGPWRMSEDLRVQRCLNQLLAFHALGVGRTARQQATLLEAFDRVEQPGTALRHRMAAYFHEMGAEDRIDRLFPNSAPIAAPAHGPAITQLTPTLILRGGKELEYSEGQVRPADWVRIDVKLRDFEVRLVAGRRVAAFHLQATLRSPSGQTVVDRQHLHGAEGTHLTQVFDEANPVHYEFHFEYQVPARLLPGNYELELRVIDLGSGEVSREVIDLEVKR